MENIDKHLNELNRPLYDKLLQEGYKFNFKTKFSNQAWFLRRSPGERKVYCITSTSKTPHPEQLTHELLHVWLESQGYIHYEEMDQNLNQYEIYKLIKIICPLDTRIPLASNDCFVVFDNMLAHVRMLDEFVALGFDKSKFLYTKPDFEERQHHYKQMIENSKVKKNSHFIMDYWNLQMTKKMETLKAKEIETLDGLLQTRSKSWYEFSETMYKAWTEEFSQIYNLCFYKKLVDEYKRLKPE